MTTQENWREDFASAEPHFNDERTLRSAQPVVPLETVTKERRRRWLMLGGAFVIACLLGAAAAMALIRLRQPSIIADTMEGPIDAQTHEQPVQPNDSADAVAESADSQSAAAAATSDVGELQPAKGKKKKSPKHAAAPSQVRIMIRTGPVPSNSGEARLVDSWQEKRQRRASRDRDPQQNHHPSDLFRIREIFEGPRRPRRANNY
ncbi:MAG TPA: hypothetical protein VLA93_14835 [Pyrinomonadaceae bacterium]|nr:hypothetical protein [Pyrinomonadaceae bacterium]